ncbi:unnamed protein product, partial [Timema podura]|nr:unnamed protein product [Timema podura]
MELFVPSEHNAANGDPTESAAMPRLRRAPQHRDTPNIKLISPDLTKTLVLGVGEENYLLSLRKFAESKRLPELQCKVFPLKHGGNVRYYSYIQVGDISCNTVDSGCMTATAAIQLAAKRVLHELSSDECAPASSSATFTQLALCRILQTTVTLEVCDIVFLYSLSTVTLEVCDIVSLSSLSTVTLEVCDIVSLPSLSTVTLEVCDIVSLCSLSTVTLEVCDIVSLCSLSTVTLEVCDIVSLCSLSTVTLEVCDIVSLCSLSTVTLEVCDIVSLCSLSTVTLEVCDIVSLCSLSTVTLEVCDIVSLCSLSTVTLEVCDIVSLCSLSTVTLEVCDIVSLCSLSTVTLEVCDIVSLCSLSTVTLEVCDIVSLCSLSTVTLEVCDIVSLCSLSTVTLEVCDIVSLCSLSTVTLEVCDIVSLCSLSTVTLEVCDIVSLCSLSTVTLELVNSHPGGLWLKNIPSEYLRVYKESVPEGWKDAVCKCPLLFKEEISDHMIIVTFSDKIWTPSLAPASADKKSATVKLPKGHTWNVHVTLVLTASRIYVNLIGEDLSDELVELHIMMDNFYKRSKVPPVRSPQEGNFYAAPINSEWHRVCLKKVTGPMRGILQLIDTGGEVEGELNMIWELKPIFASLPPQAVLCRLAGLEGFAEDMSLKEHISARITKKQFVAVVLSRTPCVTVMLYDTSKEEIINININMAKSISDTARFPKLQVGVRQTAYVSYVCPKEGTLYLTLEPKKYIHYMNIMFNYLMTTDNERPNIVRPSFPVDQGKMYLVSESEGSSWLRAKAKRSSQSKVEVQCIDYGKHVIVHPMQLVVLDNLSPALVNIPSQ